MKAYDELLDYIGIVTHQTVACAYCGAMIPYGQIRRTDNFLNLCSNCLRHFESLSDPIKGSVTEFLIGNVI
jgi:hypothetical protein